MKTEIVETRSGLLRGRRTESGLFFGGVPFASASIGDLRWAPPLPVEPWTGVRDALHAGASAPQLAVGRLGPISWLSRAVRGPMSEDCLTLNLSSPAADGEKRPVLVWLHGGAFVLGAGSTFLYNPNSLVANGNTVVVCPNYRLGALGYLDLTGLTSRRDAPSNLGLRDQIAALEWVRDNIDSFGGDPDNVTVFGESAGAMSLGALLATSPHLFRRAILESGAAANVSAPEEAAYVAERFLRSLAIRSDDLETLLAVPLPQILQAQRSVLSGETARTGRLPWQPSVDGSLLLERPLSLVEQGAARNVDVVIGTNRDEWKLFTSASLALRAMSFGELERRIERALSRRPATGPFGSEPAGVGRLEAATALDLYREVATGRQTRRTAYEAWVAFRTDEYFRMPAIALADALARSGSRIYLYRFDYPIPAFKNALGACHAAEVPLVFGTHTTSWLRPLYLGSRQADRLSKILQEAWVAFARTGTPSDRELPQWPVHTPADRATRILGAAERSELVIADPEGATRRLWMDGARP